MRWPQGSCRIQIPRLSLPERWSILLEGVIRGLSNMENLVFESTVCRVDDQNRGILGLLVASSHLLQPLDVGCFAVLKKFYGLEVAEYMKLGIDSIEKDDSLEKFPQTREHAFKDTTIQNSFAATGLVPLRPELCARKAQYSSSIPTPPGSTNLIRFNF